MSAGPRTVLFIDHAEAMGGAERMLVALLAHLDKAVWQPHIACTGGRLASAASAAGLPAHIVPMPALRRSARFPVDWLRGAEALCRLAIALKPAAMVANTVRAAVYAAPAAQLVRRPFVWYRHDMWLTESRPRQMWADRVGKRVLCAAAASLIANSQVTARQHHCPGKMTVVYNGIEIPPLPDPEIAAGFRKRYGIPPDAPLAGMLGRLNPIKGQHRFLAAMAAVARQQPDARFLIAGGEVFEIAGDFGETLRRQAGRLGLADRTVFTGQVDRPWECLAAMDVFVQPGDEEAFGLTNIEAMAMGRPVVAFAHGAMPEIVVDGVTGLLVPPGDEVGLARATLELLRNPARRAAMGAAGRTTVAARFDIRDTAAAVADILASLPQ